MRNVLSLNVLLWFGQVLLGLFFIVASGAPKLLLPAEALPMPIPLPQAFLYFVGTCEVLGGLGLILPGLTRIQPRLTVLAASCLAVLTVCACVYQVLGQQPINGVMALVFGAIAVGIAYGRSRIPLASRRLPAAVAQPV